MHSHKAVFIRFVVEIRDQESHEYKGLFNAMDELLESNELFDWEDKKQEEIYLWFKKNLKVPHVQSSESNYYAKPKAISWFKDSAKQHIEKMRQYAQILQSHEYSVLQLITDRPGKVLYEDDYQIAAIPFADTFK
ncbi:MAG: hypothetical protein R3E90_05315 [Marinicella sp.]